MIVYLLPYYFHLRLDRGSVAHSDHTGDNDDNDNDNDNGEEVNGERKRERERGSKVIDGGSVIRGGPSLSLNDDDDYDQRRSQNEDSDEEHTQVRGFKRRQPLPLKVKVKAKTEDLGPDSISMDDFKPKESGKTGKGFLDDDSDDSDTDKKEVEGVKRGSAGRGGEGGRGRGRGGAVGSKNSESDSDDSLENQVTRKISSLKKGKAHLRVPKKEGEEAVREVEGDSDSGVAAAVKAIEGKEVRAGHSDSDGVGAGAGAGAEGPIERRGMLKKVTKKRVAGAPVGDLLHSFIPSLRIL